ncbi:hypothetical protein A0H81_12370 [Grifola frondosa]|uniref:Uncharacterized protein n=1 Tax=Grifola frondosa TaxID=5627 RepID=A0A1C7LXR7_GRIFR|nr:hypothetical protein A0H81_12370 [Grifola frondosa]
MPGAGTLNVRAARPRHWAASAFLAVLGMVALRSNGFSATAHRATMRAHSSTSLLPLYGLYVPVPGERNTLLSRDILRVRERSRCSGIPYSTLSCAGHTADCSNVRLCWCARSAALHASRSEPLGTSHSISFRVVHYPTGRFGHGTLVELYIYQYHALRASCAVTRARRMLFSLAQWPCNWAHRRVPSPRSYPRLLAVDRRDHASPRSLIMTAGSVLRPTSSSASIDAILNAFVATRSRSGHPRL